MLERLFHLSSSCTTITCIRHLKVVSIEMNTGVFDRNVHSRSGSTISKPRSPFSCLLFQILTTSYEPRQEKTNKMTGAPSKDSDQPEHPSIRCPHEETSRP